MAALYLHHALFTPEPPLLPQRNPNPETESLPGLPAVILQSMASVSTVTLRASDTFKSSHYSKPLLHPVSSEATTAFLDIPIISPRDPDHPPDPGSGWLNGPRSERDLSRTSNGRWPLDSILRRLRRLKLFYALSYTLIVVWAIYNTIRYFLSFPDFFSRQRQIISLCLGTSTTLCVAVLVSSLLLAVLNPYAHGDPSNAVEYTRGLILPYLASFLLLTPAIVNLVLVVMWRTSNDPQTTLRGRCHWDIDVVWSGVGLVCDRSPSFASWLSGAVSRLCITSLVLITYHVVLHKYRTVCQVAEIIDRGPYTRFPGTVCAYRRKSVTTVGSGGTRASRPQSFADRAESISPPPHVHTHTEPSHRTHPSITDETAQMISKIPTHDEIWVPGGIAPRSMPPATSTGAISSLHEDADLHNFVNQFRRMVHQAARDTEEGLGYASPDSSEDDDRIYLEGDQHEFDPYAEADLLYVADGRPVEVSVDPSQVQVFGRMVHRMPTITSVGSGERSSRAPSRAYSGHLPLGERSLPSSGSNTVENEVAGRSLSRQGVH
ncbi:hypothetical protein BDM02DRAFT_292919 [Thelephora ganbajun]|uniref:Uncharacterized protein n=1 Tax=Thelephora ganbajun TaxID=370292 RepID=A0ACB6Z9F7_THEGA|nr:hypothetical protein BDM02DRAFT_292919 [Thelephora ganbajun]